MSDQIPKPTLQRIPLYYRIVKKASETDRQYISSDEIGKEAGVPGAQVRKDLLPFKAKGRPSFGFNVKTLTSVLEDFLGLTEKKEAALVGVGNLGKALSSFPGFRQYGVEISVLLDNDPKKRGTAAGDHVIHSMEEAEARIREKGLKIAIITTPAEVAQEVADLLVKAGIVAIWNFTPARLTVPDHVYVLYEDLSAGIAILSCKATDH